MPNIKTKILKIQGMTCVNCENKIEKKLNKTKGIISAKVKFSNSSAIIKYNDDSIHLNDIVKVIESLDYKVGDPQNTFSDKTKTIAGTGIFLLALYIIINHFGGFNFFNAFPLAKEGMGYGMLFVIGLLTSIHCVAMCGGINLSQCIPKKEENKSDSKFATVRSSILYNFGRVASYTVIGGIVGAIGSVVNFSGTAQGIVQLLAGLFMIIMGLNMLGTFPFLRKLNPRMPKIFAKKIGEQKRSKSPLYVGLLNGLMPCGPLQAMQLYALSTGSPVKGALSMLIFSLGTVPLMFGLGALSSFLNKKFSQKMTAVSAVLVVVLGIFMLNSGVTLSGFTNPLVNGNTQTESQSGNVAQTTDKNLQTVTTKLSAGRYEPLTVTKGVPVKWIISAEQRDITGCNNEIVVPKFNIRKKLQAGDNIIEFTPTETGVFAYSCWMGMIRSKITVVEESGDAGTVASSTAAYKIPTDQIAVAELKDGSQTVQIDMEADRFIPAIVVVQKNIDTTWIINGKTINDSNSMLNFAEYNATIKMKEGENQITFTPTVDFDFSASDSSFYGYVKVVDDINTINTEAIKAEVASYTVSDNTIPDDAGLPNCCAG